MARPKFSSLLGGLWSQEQRKVVSAQAPASEREEMLPGASAVELAAAPKRPSWFYRNRLGLSIALLTAIAALAAVLVCLFPPTAGFAMALMLLASMPAFAAFGTGAGAAVIAAAGIAAAFSVAAISGIGLLAAHYASKLFNFSSSSSTRGGFEPGPAGGGTGGEVNLGLKPDSGHPAAYAKPVSLPTAPGSDTPASGHPSSYATMGGLNTGPRAGGYTRVPTAAGSTATVPTRRPLPPLNVAPPSAKEGAEAGSPRDERASPSAAAAARHGLLATPVVVDGVDSALDALAARVDAAPGATVRPA